MNRFIRALARLLPHVVIDLAVVFMVFLVLNRFNPMMGFLTNSYSQALLWVFCATALAAAVALVVRNRREK